MDIKESIRIKVFKTVFIVLIPLMVYLFVSSQPIIYETYCDDIIVGYVNSKKDVKKVYNDIIKELTSEFGEIMETNNKFTYNKIKETNIKLSTYEQLKKNICERIDVKVNGYKIIIDDIELGYVLKEEESKGILETLGLKYIDINKLKKEDIQNIEVKAKVKYESKLIHPSQILNKDKIADKIIEINKSKNNPIAKVEISLIKKEKQNIEPSTIYKNSDEMVMGQNKVINGIEGSKEVAKEILYVNQCIKSEKQISENILKEPVDRIVYKGSKNPIASKTPFLEKPSRGYISSDYGPRWGNKIHHGIDIAGNTGTDVKAAFEGKVIDTSYHEIYGKKVMIDHGNGIQTLYGHCDEILVKKGNEVKQGQVIAKMGNTGRSTGPHLHFEVRINGKTVNPNEYIKQ